MRRLHIILKNSCKQYVRLSVGLCTAVQFCFSLNFKVVKIIVMNLQTSTKNSPFSSPIINGNKAHKTTHVSKLLNISKTIVFHSFLLGSTVLLSLNHYIQATTWDCGITCIMMILSEDKADNLRHNLFNICPEECQNQRLVFYCVVGCGTMEGSLLKLFIFQPYFNIPF